MKKESFDVLSHLFALASGIPIEKDAMPISDVLDHLKRITMLEMVGQTRKSKLNEWDFVSNDKTRAISSIHYEGGFLCSTDGHILMKLKSEYPPSVEGKNIYADGSECTLRYPDANKTIEKTRKILDESGSCFYFSPSIIAQIHKEAKAMQDMMGKLFDPIVKIGDGNNCTFLYSHLKHVFRFMQDRDVWEIRYANKTERFFAAMIEKDGEIVIVTPATGDIRQMRGIIKL